MLSAHYELFTVRFWCWRLLRFWSFICNKDTDVHRSGKTKPSQITRRQTISWRPLFRWIQTSHATTASNKRNNKTAKTASSVQNYLAKTECAAHPDKLYNFLRTCFSFCTESFAGCIHTALCWSILFFYYRLFSL